MKRAAIVFALYLCACQPAIKHVGPTQVLVRVEASDEVRDITATLRIRIATQQEAGSDWVDHSFEPVPAVDYNGKPTPFWPADIPVVPLNVDSPPQLFEIVIVALDSKNAVLVQQRAITSFIKQAQLVLTLTLRRCIDRDGILCGSNTDCHGTLCQTCVSDACVDTPIIDARSLPTITKDGGVPQPPMDAGRDVVADASMDSSLHPDASMDSGPHPDASMDAADAVCERSCVAELALHCAGDTRSMGQCVTDCVSELHSVESCIDESATLRDCFANGSLSCTGSTPGSSACGTEAAALNACRQSDAGGPRADAGSGGIASPDGGASLSVQCGAITCSSIYQSGVGAVPGALPSCCLPPEKGTCGFKDSSGCTAPLPADPRCPSLLDAGPGGFVAGCCLESQNRCGIDLTALGQGCVTDIPPLLVSAVSNGPCHP